MKTENPFENWDRLIKSMHHVDPYDSEQRRIVATELERERSALKSSGYDVSTRSHCTDCY